MNSAALNQICTTGWLLHNSGHREQASRLLGDVLAAHDPDTATPDDHLIHAACLWCLATGDGRVTWRWARYVYTGCLAKHGPGHPATVLAGEILAEAYLHCDNRTAMDVRRDLLTTLTANPAHPAPTRGRGDQRPQGARPGPASLRLLP